MKRIMMIVSKSIAVLLSIVLVSPLLITLVLSLMSETELAPILSGTAFFSFIPDRVTGQGYFELLIASQSYLKAFWNSLIITCSTTLLHTVAAMIVAFVLAKLRFTGRRGVLFAYLVVMLMPYQATLLSNYLIAKQLSIINTWWALVLPGVFSPLGTLVLYPFMKDFPDEIVGAALLETSSRFHILVKIILPNIRAGIVMVIVLIFADNWNMVEQPLILLNDVQKYPLSLALSTLKESTPRAAFSGAILYALPVIMLYSLCKNEISDGIVSISKLQGEKT